jgi:hypothetical protein
MPIRQNWPRKRTHHSIIIHQTSKVMDSFVRTPPVLVWLVTDSHSTSILHERIVLGQVEGRLRSAMFLSNAHYQRLIATLRYHIIE